MIINSGALRLLAGFTVFSLILMTASTHAMAERLTEDNVSDFIQETSRLTAAQYAEDFDKDAVRDYLDKHLHEDARFKSTMSYAIPGHDAQRNAISLDKKKYIESIMDAPKALGGYDIDIEITDIRIAKDGANAIVQTRSREQGTMEVPGAGAVPMEGVSNCNQVLVMSKRDVIQMYSAQCQTDIQFSGMGY